MSTNKSTQGIALVLSKSGIIQQVLYNNIGVDVSTAQLLPTIFCKHDFRSALSMLQKLKTDNIVVDLPLAMDIDGQPTSIYFSGVCNEDNLVVIGANSQGADTVLYDELTLLNNELANNLRDALKQIHKSNNLSEPDLDAFTQLNNDLVNTQRELSKTNKQLEVLNEQKNQLIGVAAHDLRNPLTVISGYIQFVKSYSDNLTDSQIQMLTKATDAADKMIFMLEDLLDLSEIESGKVNLKLQLIDFVALIELNIELNQVIADKKNIKINFSRDDLPLLVFDSGKIEQVINNILSNGIKYSHSDTVIEVSLTQKEQTLELIIKDQGQGIPEQELEKIFQAYATTSVKSTAGEKSTGLGLAITQKIVEAHGGTIAVESKQNQGSSFIIHLPVRTELAE
jgi:two-component system, OmpR family, sensor kinase